MGNPHGVDSGLRNKSIFNPQINNNHQIEVFKHLVLKDLDGIKIQKNVNPNHVTEGIKSLEKRKDVILRPADKGGRSCGIG